MSDIDSVSELNTDFNNNVFLYFNNNGFYKKFKIKDHQLVEDGLLKTHYFLRFSAENGIYIYDQELPNEKYKLIIQSELHN